MPPEVRMTTNDFKRRALSLSLLITVMALTAGTLAQNTTPNPAADWWKHIQYLASDELAGRETGSAEHRQAAQYIADAFKRAGLNPAGIGGYFQPVKFVSRKVIEPQSSLAILRNGKPEQIVLGEEATLSMSIEAPARTEAPMVLVGYGLA